MGGDSGTRIKGKNLGNDALGESVEEGESGGGGVFNFHSEPGNPGVCVSAGGVRDGLRVG